MTITAITTTTDDAVERITNVQEVSTVLEISQGTVIDTIKKALLHKAEVVICGRFFLTLMDDY